MRTRKKTPTWATIVGVLGLCFGAMGTLSGAYGVLMPAMFSANSELMLVMKQTFYGSRQYPAAPARRSDGTLQAGSERFMEQLLRMPKWYARWSVADGATQLVLGMAYVLGALLLLLVRRGAPALFMAAAAASLLRNLISVALAVSAASLLAYWLLGTALCGALVDLGLLTTVALADKSAYQNPPAAP